eukprot:Gb_35787 [translate_table: standard]
MNSSMEKKFKGKGKGKGKGKVEGGRVGKRKKNVMENPNGQSSDQGAAEEIIRVGVISEYLMLRRRRSGSGAVDRGVKLEKEEIIKSRHNESVEKFFANIQSESGTEDVMKLEEWLGNAKRAFKEQKWEECVAEYCKCDAAIGGGLGENCGVRPKRIVDMYLERACAYNGLHKYEDAVTDVEAALSIDPFNHKGVLIKTSSLVHLGQYREANYHVEGYCHMFPSDYGVQRLFRNHFRRKCALRSRIGDEIVGVENVGDSKATDDDFIGPVEIQMTKNGCGRGLFATESVKAGEVLLICKPYALSLSESFAQDDPLENGLVQNFLDLRHSIPVKLFSLFLSFLQRSSSDKESVEDVPPMEVFVDVDVAPPVESAPVDIDMDRALQIVKRIAFDDLPVPVMENRKRFDCVQSRFYHGVWLLPSFINHSCVPNASRVHADNLMSIHASRDIRRGEEITIPYFDVLFPYFARESTCAAWGFRCLCRRCDVERSAEKPLSEMGMHFRVAYRELLRGTKADMDRRLSKLSRIYNDVENILENHHQDIKHANWIKASFIVSCLAQLSPKEKEGEDGAAANYMGNLLRAMEVISATCPGDVRYLLLAAKHVVTLRNEVVKFPNNAFLKRYLKMAEERFRLDCIRVYGNHKPYIAERVFTRIFYKQLL